MELETEKVEAKKPSIYPWIVTVIICAWLIGMSILGAGWLISKEIAKQSVGQNPAQPVASSPVDIQIPDNKPVLGNKDAKVTIIEFADYQCPFCGQWEKEIYRKLKSEFIDQGSVKFIFWDFAFLGEESLRAAEAAMCANDQNKYWEYHDKLFDNQAGENQNAFSDANLKRFAAELNLNTTDFESCVNNRTHKTLVEESTNAGVGYGVNSTPTTFINGMKFEGVMPWENYKQIIDSELSK